MPAPVFAPAPSPLPCAADGVVMNDAVQDEEDDDDDELLWVVDEVDFEASNKGRPILVDEK